MKLKNLINPIKNMPMPLNINMWWNLGSIIGIMLISQIISGFILSMNYCPNIQMAFESVFNIKFNNSNGWMLHNIHINGASLFFINMYIHIARGIFFSSYNLRMTWITGMMIMIFSMMTAFMGYVLPWGQMSYWGATVITNLISALPYCGNMMVEWIWGGFNINNSTLNRFFSIHFILPLIILSMVMLHIMFLHKSGSNNPMGLKSKLFMVPFQPYFLSKDIVGFLIIFIIIMILCTLNPYILTDPDNFTMANPMVTPPHIKPEWYFLYAYSILRSIPNKLGGVTCMLMSMLMLLTLMLNKSKMLSMKMYPSLFWLFCMNFFILSWSGGKTIEHPFSMLALSSSSLYFMLFPSFMMIMKEWDKINFK